MPPLPADSIHARACKLKCEKILTRPKGPVTGISWDEKKEKKIRKRPSVRRNGWSFSYVSFWESVESCLLCSSLLSAINWARYSISSILSSL